MVYYSISHKKVSLIIVNFSFNEDKLYFRGLGTIDRIYSKKFDAITIRWPAATPPYGTEGSGKIIPLRFKLNRSVI